MVLDLARQLDLDAVEEDLRPYDLYTADEAFITGTSPRVLPVTRADNRRIGDRRPGPVTKQLLAAWSETGGVDIVGQAFTHPRASLPRPEQRPGSVFHSQGHAKGARGRRLRGDLKDRSRRRRHGAGAGQGGGQRPHRGRCKRRHSFDLRRRDPNLRAHARVLIGRQGSRGLPTRAYTSAHSAKCRTDGWPSGLLRLSALTLCCRVRTPVSKGKSLGSPQVLRLPFQPATVMRER